MKLLYNYVCVAFVLQLTFHFYLKFEKKNACHFMGVSYGIIQLQMNQCLRLFL